MAAQCHRCRQSVGGLVSCLAQLKISRDVRGRAQVCSAIFWNAEEGVARSWGALQFALRACAHYRGQPWSGQPWSGQLAERMHT